MAQFKSEQWSKHALLNATVQDGTVELWGIVDSEGGERGRASGGGTGRRRAGVREQRDRTAGRGRSLDRKSDRNDGRASPQRQRPEEGAVR